MVRIPENHRKVISELKEKAVAHAVRRNQSPGQMVLGDHKDWSGHVEGVYPPYIEQGGHASSFTHSGTPPSDSKGSYGAVIYFGTNQQGVDANIAWVLAWHVPGDGNPNQVYVETGPKTRYPQGNVNWDEIQTALNNSTDASSHVDDHTHAEASATIDRNGNTAKISVVYDVSS